MWRSLSTCLVLVLLLVPFAAVAQETPPAIVDAYDALADTILAVRAAEASFVRSFLDGHFHAAEMLMQQGEWEACAAQMALFANEGDNAIGGVRKKLLEGGHHFNADGEEKGIYEPGYVIVTKKAKVDLLAASSAMRSATDDAAREEAWGRFSEIAKDLLETSD